MELCDENDRAPKLTQIEHAASSAYQGFVTDEESAELSLCGLSNAAYMSAAGLNHSAKAHADIEAIRELIKLNADLGRVAGILKL